jgi:hypothetical protein
VSYGADLRFCFTFGEKKLIFFKMSKPVKSGVRYPAFSAFFMVPDAWYFPDVNSDGF